MAEFKYKAIDQDGNYITSTISAENPSDLLSFLRRSSLEMVSYKEIKKSNISFLSSGLKTNDLISIFIHLEQLDKAGVSIIDAIQDLKENSDVPTVKVLMHEVHTNIKNGNMFSESLAKRPDIFNPTYVGLIAMGEKTGTLSNSFLSIIDDIKWANEIKRKTKKATTGPLFGIIVMFSVIGIMTTVVVPKVTAFLTSTGTKLPVATTSLMAFSAFMQNYFLQIILFVIASIVSFKIIGKIESVAFKLDKIKLKLPLFGPIITKIESAKFCQFFGLTFKSGLGVLECLDASAGVVSNRAFKSAIQEIRAKISEGKSIAVAIAESQMFPGLVSRMFKVGEDSGNMDASLKNIKFFYEREINDSIDKLVGLIQPTMMFVMGGMLGWIAVAVFGPIYGSFANMK